MKYIEIIKSKPDLSSMNVGPAIQSLTKFNWIALSAYVTNEACYGIE